MGYHEWRIDEAAFAGRENLDAGHLARFDAKTRDFGIDRELALLSDLGLGEGSTLVDLGAGTGERRRDVGSD